MYHGIGKLTSIYRIKIDFSCVTSSDILYELKEIMYYYIYTQYSISFQHGLVNQNFNFVLTYSLTKDYATVGGTLAPCLVEKARLQN